jgi:hypothetical protein
VAAGAVAAQRPAHHLSPAHRPVHPVIYKAPWPTTPVITARYVYFPGGKPDPNAAPSVSECAPTGENCTTEELCEMWGQC